MSNFRFIVEGPLRGYRASARNVFKKDPMARLPQLAAFKERVVWTAMSVGWRPREVTADTPVKLSVAVSWTGAPRIDWKNVYGLIEDALFKQDRFVIPGPANDVNWNIPCKEFAEVEIEDEHQ